MLLIALAVQNVARQLREEKDVVCKAMLHSYSQYFTNGSFDYL